MRVLCMKIPPSTLLPSSMKLHMIVLELPVATSRGRKKNILAWSWLRALTDEYYMWYMLNWLVLASPANLIHDTDAGATAWLAANFLFPVFSRLSMNVNLNVKRAVSCTRSCSRLINLPLVNLIRQFVNCRWMFVNLLIGSCDRSFRRPSIHQRFSPCSIVYHDPQAFKIFYLIITDSVFSTPFDAYIYTYRYWWL